MFQRKEMKANDNQQGKLLLMNMFVDAPSPEAEEISHNQLFHQALMIYLPAHIKKTIG